MYARRAPLLLALALAALAPAPASAQAARGPTQWGLLVGVEDDVGPAALQLRADLEFPGRPLSPLVNFSFVGSLGYSRWHDDGIDYFWGEEWEQSMNLLRVMGAARLSLGRQAFRPYFDAGAGLYYGSWSGEYRELSYPYYQYSYDDSDIGVVLRLAVGATFQVSPGFSLGAELGLMPYIGDLTDDSTTSALVAATFRM